MEYEEIGYMKFSGEAVQSGVIDAGSAGMALLGLDEAVRFFNEKQSPDFAKIEYQIPVRTTDGSWTAWVLGIVGTGAGVLALSYLKKAGEKMAEKDFKDIGFNDVLKKSIDAIQHLIKLIKHTKMSHGWDTKNVQWRNNNSEIGILNTRREPIFLPVAYLNWFLSLPPQLISKITGVVAQERTLSIGVKRGGDFEEVSVNVDEKVYFFDYEIEAEEDYLFPEMKHGDEVKLEGRLTRGNASSNSIGLEYAGHILNCIPEQGSIRRFKSALFLRCIVEGTINRLSKQRMVAEKRPTIVVRKIIPLERDDQYDLFHE
jgi:hypothetical protein